MAQERPRRKRLLKALGVVLGLALVTLCCVQSVRLAQGLVQSLLPAPFEAAPACAHETPTTSSPTPQESLVAAVTSYRSSGHGFYSSVVTNAALCIVRADDGALVRHYALDGHAYVLNLTSVDGMIYIRSQLSPDQNVQVCAMRASDGTRLWCQVNHIADSAGSLPRMPLIASEGTLYIQELTRIVATRASDGTTLWQHTIDPSDQNRRGIAVANESVYVPSIDVPVQGNRQVCALQATDGTTRWCAHLNTLSGIAKLVVDTTGVYVLGHGANAPDAEIVALRPTDGAIQWRRTFQLTGGGTGPYSFGETNDDAFTVGNGLLYLSTSDSGRAGRFTALRTSDGTTRWELATDQIPTVAVHSDIAYIADNSANLQAFQASDGKPLWKQRFVRVSQLIAGAETLYVLDNVGDLHGIAASDGRLLWERAKCDNLSADTAATEPHIENGAAVWCGWGTDRVSDSNGQSTSYVTPGALAVEP